MLRYMLISLTIALTGCSANDQTGAPESLVTRNSEAVLPFSFRHGGSDIAAVERARISRFLDGLGLSNGDIVVIPVPGPSDGSASKPRKSELRGLMARHPARLHLVDRDGLPGIGGSSDRGIIRVTRAYATEAVCKAPPGEPGCANARDLAQMVAVPADVILPGQGQRHIPVPKADPLLPAIAPALP